MPIRNQNKGIAMKKWIIVVLASALLIQTPSYAGIIQGSSKSCKVGKVKQDLKYKYKCVKPGVWKKTRITLKNETLSVPILKDDIVETVVQPLSSQTSAPVKTDTPIVENTELFGLPSEQSDSIESCKIKEQNSNRDGMLYKLTAGFPGTTLGTAKTGTVKWALIPIDFPDVRGQSNFKSRVDDQMKLLSEWFSIVSDGKFKVEWVVADNWVTLPNSSSQYAISHSVNLGDASNGSKLFKEAMAAADPVFDFTGIQTVNFILPQGQTVIQETSQGFPWDKAVKELVTKEGPISSFSIPGVFFDHPQVQYWSYWVHEFGHAIGIPHIGSSREPNPFMGLDIMSNQDGESKELSGWMRFVTGWMPDEKVYCKQSGNLKNIDITLTPLSETKDGIKMVVIPVSNTKAVVIESRRENKFSCQMPSKRNGVLVYTYDATLSHGQDFLKPVTPTGRVIEGSLNCRVVPYPNPIIYEGQKITVDGIGIELLKSSNYDKIRIYKN